MLKFINEINQIFELSNEDYFCLVNDKKEVHEELIEVVEDILEQNKPNYLITTLKYNEVSYKPTVTMFPIKLEYYNNLHGLIIKKGNLNTIEDLNNLVLKINNNFVPFEFISPINKKFLLNNTVNISITRLKDLKILLNHIIYDDLEEVNYQFDKTDFLFTLDEINTLIKYVKTNKSDVLDLIKDRQLDDTLLYGLFVLSGIDIEKVYLKEKTKIIKSDNKDIIFKGQYE